MKLHFRNISNEMLDICFHIFQSLLLCFVLGSSIDCIDILAGRMALAGFAGFTVGFAPNMKWFPIRQSTVLGSKKPGDIEKAKADE